MTHYRTTHNKGGIDLVRIVCDCLYSLRYSVVSAKCVACVYGIHTIP